jgi:hypothetical protein
LSVDVVPSCTASRHFDPLVLNNIETATFKVLRFDSQFESGEFEAVHST